jgi:2-polyprenyl-6-methoxyphenol hydroxylase-like FAD-dependent oxidoreductase
MVTSGRVLIAGASIAGPALAYWMSRAGWDVVVVERASEPRTAGQNVDVRGAGREVLSRMGLDQAALGRTTGEVGLVFLGEDGSRAGEFPAASGDVDGATAELEILRGDLSELVVGAASSRVDYRYGVTVEQIRDDASGVTVRLSDGVVERVDLVVAADGLNSATRSLMGCEVEPRWLGLETTYFTIPRTDADDDWWRWFNAAGGGRSVHLRPDRHGTIRATLNEVVRRRDRGAPRRSRSEQVEHLVARFADAGWQTPRVLEELVRAQDVYFESVGQIRLDRWSRGRRLLIGDAAWCASPLSGMGTTLALVGAYVFAGEITRPDRSLPDALRTAEAVLRPYVRRAQRLPPGGPRLANPATRTGVRVLSAVVRVLSSPPLRSIGDLASSRPADDIELPAYPQLG